LPPQINTNQEAKKSGNCILAGQQHLFFSASKFPYKQYTFEEKIYREVAKVEKGREKQGFVPKLIRLFRLRG
jgi:hypothetical protein